MHMTNGVYLTLMAGPVIPVPVPAAVADALTAVRVTVASKEEKPAAAGAVPAHARSGFELRFTFGNRSPLEALFLLTGGGSPPLLRVVLVATVNGAPEVLIDGFVLKHDVKHGGGAVPSTLTLYGKDLTAAMDLFQFTGLPYPAMPVPARVLFVLAKYAVLGVAPVVLPTPFPDLPDPTERVFSQKGTDYAYLCTLADESGYVFHVDPGPVPGTSTAYWGPEVKVGAPQPALSIDMDAMTTGESLTFQFDNETAATPVAFLRPDALPVPLPVPVPDVSLVNPPLGLIPPARYKTVELPNVAKMSFPQAMLFGLSRAAAAAECVTADGTLNVARYGRLLKARQLVGVRGAGVAFDGLYYVKTVTHEIQRGEYRQLFKLTRNGLVSTVPVVPV
jgi:hypothetical protein